MKKSANRGFTLIELLVVIAIIAILAAILFPVFAQAREKARQISCISNQRQIGLGILQYVQDFDETYPMDQYDYLVNGGPQQMRWAAMVQPYIKNGEIFGYDNLAEGAGGVFHCPSFPSDQPSEYGLHLDLFPDGPTWTGSGFTVPQYKVKSIAVVDTPSDSVMMVEKGQNLGNDSWLTFPTWEGYWTSTVGNPPGSVDTHNDLIDNGAVMFGLPPAYRNCDYQYSAAYNPNQWSTYAQCGSYPRYRHNNTTDVLFCDGHVQSIVKGNLNWYTNIYIPKAYCCGGTW